jgi:hypothetical protein
VIDAASGLDLIAAVFLLRSPCRQQLVCQAALKDILADAGKAAMSAAAALALAAVSLQ